MRKNDHKISLITLVTIKRGCGFLKTCIIKKLDKTLSYHFLKWSFKHISYCRNKSEFCMLLQNSLSLNNFPLKKKDQKTPKQNQF